MLMRQLGCVIALALCLFVSCASAQILNSERIEQTFGSFGIEVLYSDAAIRLSNLYSDHDGRSITRTLAIVGYPQRIEPAFALEHAAIVAGGSIGATFAAAAWEVTKVRHAYFSSSEASVAAIMGLDAETSLATHAYLLEIRKAGVRHDYAWIIEIHHPDYLGLEDLVEIYGPASAQRATVPDLPAAVRDLWRQGRRLLEGSLALGQQRPEIDDR